MEKIYTIPVNEAFKESAENPECGCPFCSIYNKLEDNELEIILGAAMMEPDTRIKTNKEGFCRTHYDMMFVRKNRLGMALMLESHLDELRNETKRSGITGILAKPGTKASKRIGELECSCYVCGRIDFHFKHMIETAVLLWESDPDFKPKLEAQPYFCLPHFKMMLDYAQYRLPKKLYPDFAEKAEEVEFKYFDKLREDISWFCKKFDYRYEDEPWKDSKDAIDRAIKFLDSDLHNYKPEKKKV